MRRPLYFIHQALGSLFGSPGISLLTSGTIAAALLVMAMYAMALQNLEKLTLVWGRTATVSAYLRDDLPEDAWQAARRQVAALPSVERATLVSPKQALERFRARGREAAALVTDVTEDALPAAIEVDLKTGFADLTAVEALAQSIAALPGISTVDYGQQEFERLQALLAVLRYGGIGLGLLILLATAFIVSNTIRLTVYARKDEISILLLVGATRWFVRLPFVIEGGLWGFFGGAFAVLLMWLSDFLFAERLSLAIADVVGSLNVSLFDPAIAVAVLIAGVGLGVCGSALAVGRFLDVEEE